jgi:uncharacterized membrane protein (Fun14 family)
MRAGIRNPVGVGLGLLIGAVIGFALAYSPWVLVALVGLTAGYVVLRWRH